MEREKIKELALNLMFKVNEEETDDIANDFVLLEKMLSFFDEIDTEGVEEMVYPLEQETVYLRSDDLSEEISQADALQNVSKVKQGHVVVPKVVR